MTGQYYIYAVYSVFLPEKLADMAESKAEHLLIAFIFRKT